LTFVTWVTIMSSRGYIDNEMALPGDHSSLWELS
jgi:hypothetical protein